jgi:hypothetical protein
MANTFNGMTADNVAQEGISTLEKALVPMSGFTLDLSSDIMEQGTTVSTRIVPAATAATDLVDDESNSYAAVIDNQTTNAVQVTLDPHPVTGFAFSRSSRTPITALLVRLLLLPTLTATMLPTCATQQLRLDLTPKIWSWF